MEVWGAMPREGQPEGFSMQAPWDPDSFRSCPELGIWCGEQFAVTGTHAIHLFCRTWATG